MLTDILLQKLSLNPEIGWQKTLIPAQHARLRSSTGNRTTSHQGYAPLVRYSINNAPITLSAGNALQQLVAEASGRPFLVVDPLDFKASASPTYDSFGGWTMGALKFIGGRQTVGPTVCKVYGVEGVRDIAGGVSRHRVFLRPLTYVEDGEADVLGNALPFTLDAITREVLLDGQRMIPPTTFDGLGRFPQQAGTNQYLGASFKFWTAMEVTEFTLTPVSGASVQQTLIAGRNELCIAYNLNMTLTEVLPIFDPILQLDTIESVIPTPCALFGINDFDADDVSRSISFSRPAGTNFTNTFTQEASSVLAHSTGFGAGEIVWSFINTDVCHDLQVSGPFNGNCLKLSVTFEPLELCGSSEFIRIQAACVQDGVLYVNNNEMVVLFNDMGTIFVGSLGTAPGTFTVTELDMADPFALGDVNAWERVADLITGEAFLDESSHPNFTSGSKLRFGVAFYHPVDYNMTHDDRFRINELIVDLSTCTTPP